MKNPYNINNPQEENNFLAWQEGYNSSLSIENNPFSDQAEPELFKIWEEGYSSNKNRAKVIPTVTASSTPIQSVIVDSRLSSAAIGAPVDLSSVSTEIIFQEVARRLKEGEELLNRVKKLLG